MPLKLGNGFAKDNLTKNLVRNYKLVTHLDKFLSDEVEHFEFKYEPKIRDDAWHPSGHCIPTATELYQYAILEHGIVHDFSVSLLKTFLVGHFWHQLLQHAVLELGFATPDAIERKGIRIWGNQNTPEPFHWVTGSGDIAPCSIPIHGDYVVDFKTMGNHDYKNNGVPAWCAKKYEAQINIYMDLFDVDRALIVCIQKDSPHEMKEFEYRRNQDLIDVIYDKWEFVSECLDVGEVPLSTDDDMFELEFEGPIG